MIGGILLAAGSSTRFGSDKRNALLPGGETVLDRSLAVMCAAVDEVLLVIGEGDSQQDYQARFPDIRVMRALGSDGGMGCSLARAIATVADWDGCLVSLADKPFIAAATMQLMRERLAKHAIVAPVYRHEIGHPVGFARRYFPELAQLEGDRGARSLLQRAGAECLYVDVDDAGVVADIDTPADLRLWSRQLVR